MSWAVTWAEGPWDLTVPRGVGEDLGGLTREQPGAEGPCWAAPRHRGPPPSTRVPQDRPLLVFYSLVNALSEG